MNRITNIFNEISWQIMGTFLYLLISTFYLISLNNFNKLIIGKNYIEIMTYNNGKAWFYLTFSFLLMILGASMTYWLWKSKLLVSTIDSIISLFICIIIIIIICISIIIYIQNPILRAAFIVILGGSAFASTIND